MYSVDPVRIFEISGNVSTVAPGNVTATVGSDRQVVAAVSGKSIRVMGWIAQGTAAAGTYIFKDGSGGSTLVGPYTHPATGTNPDSHPIEECGYFETSTGVGLYADVATTNVVLTVFYITYTPP